MPPTISWLEQLKLDQLRRLAVLIGSPCSGTKAVRVAGIQNALSNVAMSTAKAKSDSLRVVSIDMGIRNLAYAHFKSPLPDDNRSERELDLSLVVLDAWKRLSFGTSSIATSEGATPEGITVNKPEPTARESFEPIDYAAHAYHFIEEILDLYNPTHVLIERQRFRSGGNSAVQEWTLRVGVFEGMLYAVLHTLIARRNQKCTVIPMAPPQVNRYWLANTVQNPLSTADEKITGKAVKKMKVDLVGKILEKPGSDARSIKFSDQAGLVRSEFLDKWKHGKKNNSKEVLTLSKLDDAADSLLQGLAWINWENNRRRIRLRGRDAFDLG